MNRRFPLYCLSRTGPSHPHSRQRPLQKRDALGVVISARSVVRPCHRAAVDSNAGYPRRRGEARLEDYSFGRVTVDGWRRDGHSLALEDLDEVLDELAER